MSNRMIHIYGDTLETDGRYGFKIEYSDNGVKKSFEGGICSVGEIDDNPAVDSEFLILYVERVKK
jgi:hypothetical protein